MPQKLMIMLFTMLAMVSSAMTVAGQSPSPTFDSQGDIDPVILIASDIAADSPYPEITDLPAPEVFAPASNLRPLAPPTNQPIGSGGVIVARPSSSTILPQSYDPSRQPVEVRQPITSPQLSACREPATVRYPITPVQAGDNLTPADRAPSLLEPSPSLQTQIPSGQVFPAPTTTMPSYNPASSTVPYATPSNLAPYNSTPYNSAPIVQNPTYTPVPTYTMPARVVDYTVPMNPPTYVAPAWPTPSVTGPVVVAYPQTGVYGPLPTTGRGPSAATSRPPLNRDFTVGNGLYGQPTVYVDGQPVRNFLRWLSP